MPLIWAAISAHGYGHAAQVVPVLNALGSRVPGLRALLRTTVPASFFKDRLLIPWELSAVQQDVGCIQDGPLTIDTEATWQAHRQFHETLEKRLLAEVDAMRTARPELVLADAPYLALAGAKQAGIPSVALVSLTWDLILAAFPSPPSLDRTTILKTIRHAYRQATHALRMSPSPDIDVFADVSRIGPIAEPAAPARDHLAAALNLVPEEQTVLVGFGGIPLDSLPFLDVEPLHPYRFLFEGPVPAGSRRIVSTQSLPFSFKTLLASVDIIMTKPGYGTIVEAVALQRPVVYVRRYNFAEEQSLVDYLHHHGRAIELTREEFFGGRWQPALDRVLRLPGPPSPPPPSTGATDATTVLAGYL